MSKSPAKKDLKDALLYVTLRKAHDANVVIVAANATRLNHPGSPVWEPGENIGPLLAILLISVLFFFTVNLIVGTGTMVLGVLLFVVFIRPWVLQRVSRRAIEAATQNVHNWDVLWKKGGLAVMLRGVDKSRCTSPAGDWRGFVTTYVRHGQADGAELHNEFSRAVENDPGAIPASDLYM